MRKVYLDNGSTSFPKAPGVGSVIKEYLENVGCNIGRGGYESSYSLAERIFNTKEKLCNLFSFNQESNVVFTPNVTYSLNFVIGGLLHSGDHVIISSMEHNAVARPIEAARMRGVNVSIVKCDNKGRLNPKDLEDLISTDTKAVVLMHGSNVCGTLMPLTEVGAICKKYGVFFIVDTAQTAGVFPLDMDEMQIDGLAFTGHKGLLGPQGIGGLLLREKLGSAISPIIYGGTGSMSDSLLMPEFLPDKLEAGTLNLPGILGLSAALDYIEKTGIDTIRKKELALTEIFLKAMKNHKEIKVIGLDGIEGRCSIVSLDFPNRDNAEIAYQLDGEYGIMTRCGLHCAPLAHKTLGTFPQGTVRFAFGHFNTEEEVQYAVNAIYTLLK
jgi:cysteine desulfurase family protein